MYVHNSNMDSFYKTVPKYLIPKDLGGDGDTYEELAGKIF